LDSSLTPIVTSLLQEVFTAPFHLFRRNLFEQGETTVTGLQGKLSVGKKIEE